METLKQILLILESEKPANLVAKHAHKQNRCVRMKDRKKTAKKGQLRKKKHKKNLKDDL